MSIVKKLNLNANPNNVDNYSIVCAKNIMLSKDGSYITNEEGFDIAFGNVVIDSVDITKNYIKVSIPTSYGTPIVGNDLSALSNYTILGHIDCPNEIVLFCKNGSTYKVYRAIEFTYNGDTKLALYEVPCNYSYNNATKIIGTFYYNALGELVVAITSDAGVLKIINLNTSKAADDNTGYDLAPVTPIASLGFNGRVKGEAMPSGIYYFFIRFGNDRNEYTKWFSIGVPQTVFDVEYATIFDFLQNFSSPETITKVSNLINTEDNTEYNINFILNLKFSDNSEQLKTTFKNYQIGFIVQSKGNVVGRIYSTYNFPNFPEGSYEKDINFVFDGTYIEEESLDNFVKSAFNIYNAKTLTSYNNKLYVANYKEDNANYDLDTIVDDNNYKLSDYVNAIKARLVKTPINLHNVASSDIPHIKAINKIDGYYINNTIKSLMPNEVYSFYIHYVRADGSFTNGYRLQNEETPMAPTIDPYVSGESGPQIFNSLKNVKLKDLNLTQATSLGIENIYKVPELANNYVYEICVPRNYNKYLITPFIPYKNSNGDVLFKTGDAFYGDGFLNSGEEDPTGQRTDWYYEARLCQLGVRFTNISIPNGFVGYFFSYEKVESNSLFNGVTIPATTVQGRVYGDEFYAICSNDVNYVNVNYKGALALSTYAFEENTSNDITYYKVKVFKSEYTDSDNNTHIYGRYSYIKESAIVPANSAIYFDGDIRKRYGLTSCVYVKAVIYPNNNYEYYLDYGYNAGNIINIIKLNRDIYTNKVKTLVRLTDISTEEKIYTSESNYQFFGCYNIISSSGDTSLYNIYKLNYNFNLPSYIVNDEILESTGYFLRDNKVYLVNSASETSYGISEHPGILTGAWIIAIKHSIVNTSAFTFKKEPQTVITPSGTSNARRNILVDSLDFDDLYELKGYYKEENYKAYTNYDASKKDFDTFDNIIRYSYPVQDESIVNKWRDFNSDSYHVIDKKYGSIINMFTSGLSFYIHTLRNLLVTSADAKLKADSTNISLENNDVFAISPKPIFGSELGYGGLNNIDYQLNCQHGYIWFDAEHKKILLLSESNFIDISSELDKVLDSNLDYIGCYINVDDINNRLLLTLVPSDNQNTHYLTLSYNVVTKSFISIHDYKFLKNTHTSHNIYFSGNTIGTIFKFSKDKNDIGNYKTLTNICSIYPDYSKNNNNDNYYCFFDIIYNLEYMKPKVLNSIRWSHDLINAYNLIGTNTADSDFVNDDVLNKYKDLEGANILVYTDVTSSGKLQISSDKINDLNNYKFPAYDKGLWNLNYFRNKITTDVTDSELSTIATQLGIDVDELKRTYFLCKDQNNVVHYSKSDLRSLIYGKYIVVRFIFNSIRTESDGSVTYTNNKLKFDDVIFNIEQY